MKNKLITVLLLLPAAGGTYAQTQPLLTLDSCYRMAVRNNPVTQQEQLYTNAFTLQDAGLSNAYKPQVSLNGQVGWQSDVTSLPISIPNVSIPSLDKDSYRATLDVNQLIWDGGLTRQQKAVEKAGLLANLKAVEADNYRIRETVNQLYFNILLINENENLLKLGIAEIQSRLKRIRSAVSNGVMLQSTADVIDAEILRTGQALEELKHNRLSAIYRLEQLTGAQISETTQLQMPVFDTLPALNLQARPEYQQLILLQQKLSSQQNLILLRNRPKFSAFGSLGYGKPGLNMLSNQFEPFAQLGARFTWTLWNWHQPQTDARLIGIQKEIIDTQKAAFERNQRMILNSLYEEIRKTENLIATDNDLLKLRESIARTAGVQLEQGTITASEYLTEQNAHTQARINLSIHHLQLQYAKLNYITASGLLTNF